MESMLQRMLLLSLVGLAANFVDGALGMGYGVTSSTLLLAAGLAPAAVSASVHFSKIVTGLASGASHWRLGNVDWPTVRRIGVPGCLGGFAGAAALSAVSGAAARPWIAGVLLLLGVYVFARFTLVRVEVPETTTPLRRRFLAPIGAFGGFVDAIGGGGWGPVATPSLLASGRMEPRKVIGSVNASEFFVAVCISAGFLLFLGPESVQVTVLLALLAGGVIAAPIAASIVHRVAPRPLGVAVGGLIMLTNSRVVLEGFGAGGHTALAVNVLVTAVSVAALLHAVRQGRRELAAVAEPPAAASRTVPLAG